MFLASTPTIKGLSRIEREYEASDQRRFFVPCPHCGERQYLKFERLRWQKGKAETAAYHCEGCEQPIAEHHKTQMLSQGEWRPTAIPADTLSIGFHLSSLYSPVGWLSWERIAREWEASQTSDEAKRSFINTVLGETWVETGEAPDWQRLYERREDYRRGTVPLGGLFLTAGADVQKDRIEVSVWAWGRGLESWLIDHIVIPGSSAGTGGPGDAGTWARLSALLGETWPHAGGTELGLGRLAIDTGYEAPAVYGWVRRMGSGQVVAVKGVDGFSRAAPVIGPTYVDATEGGRKIRRGAKLWTIAVATFKSETYRFLRLDKPADDGVAACPAGYRASAARHRRRMGEAAGRRAAGDGEDPARLHPAGMAEAAGAQRGARLPGLCPRRRLDRRHRPLDRAQVAGSGEAAGDRGGNDDTHPDAGDRRTKDARRSIVGSARPAVPLAGRTAAELVAAWIIQSEADHDLVTSRIGRAQKSVCVRYVAGELRRALGRVRLCGRSLAANPHHRK